MAHEKGSLQAAMAADQQVQEASHGLNTPDAPATFPHTAPLPPGPPVAVGNHHGEAVATPDTRVRVQCRIRKDSRDALKHRAVDMDVDMQDLIQQAVDEYLQNHPD